MPLSSHLAPGFIRYTYSSPTFPHHGIIPIKFNGIPEQGVEPSLETSSGGNVMFSTGIDLMIDSAIRTQYNADTNFGLADIYSVDPVTGERSWIFSHNIDAEGSNIAANVTISRATWMFKSTVGKPIKVVLMGSVYTPNSRNVGSVPADARQDVLDYMLGDDCIVYGRTDAWPLTFVSFTSKTDDVLRALYGFNDV